MQVPPFEPCHHLTGGAAAASNWHQLYLHMCHAMQNGTVARVKYSTVFKVQYCTVQYLAYETVTCGEHFVSCLGGVAYKRHFRKR